ncbi:hypothetical protein L2E82_08256 [Cichorium intybus]|uniref:Uncharacterized protein n=1 Tax=Cichorium intybus TaxID=13427 RepID=A0ACB9G5Z7_CICIN|nr:hypothetical protein L2E82_08256 [Cichorium intybus]
MGYVYKAKKQFLSNVSDDYANDVEVMLNLLTNEVGLECTGVRKRKKIDKKHIICEDKKNKNDNERFIDEVVGNIDRQQERVKEQGKILEKKDSIKGYYRESIGASQNWRKKNENKLNVSEAYTQKHNDEFDIFTNQSESRMKNKQFEETLDDGCGPKGPSDEMWHVTDASDYNISSTSENGDAVKNNERSLWSIVGDVFRFRWASPCSESHIPNSGGGKCSTCLSISSESWFSSREVDDHDNKKPSGTTESVIPLPSIKKHKDKFDEWEEAYSVESKQRKEDEMFMREAILEAKKAADVGEVPVGAVIVHGGKVIARGYNLVEELRDATAHAEMICIRQASKKLRSWRLLDTTLYVTLEPCPMCAGAILQARIDTVVWGAPNKLLGADGSWISLFNDRNEGENTIPTDKFKPPAPMHPFHQNMAVRRGVLAVECAEIMKRFFRARRNKKTEPESPIPPEPESPIPPSTITVSHHHSNFFSKMQHAFKIIFCL